MEMLEMNLHVQIKFFIGFALNYGRDVKLATRISDDMLMFRAIGCCEQPNTDATTVD